MDIENFVEKDNDFHINVDIQPYIANIDRLRTLVRYQTSLRNIGESVAEHSFYVAALVLKLHDYYDFNLEKALITALIHDIPEGSMSDVPFPIKEKHPELSKVLEDIEEDIMISKLSNEANELLKHFNAFDTPEGLVCRLADILSVVIYASDEIKTGNRFFNYIAFKAQKRCDDTLKMLEKYIKLPYTKTLIEDKIHQIMNIN